MEETRNRNVRSCVTKKIEDDVGVGACIESRPHFYVTCKRLHVYASTVQRCKCLSGTAQFANLESMARYQYCRLKRNSACLLLNEECYV
jgi:hypothetical protein